MVTGDHREAIAEVLSWASGEMTRHSLNAHPDHNRWSWRGDGHGEMLRGHFREQADALLGSDVLAQIRAEARAEALREAAEFIEVTAGIGTNDTPYADGWYAALGYALAELRSRAEGSA